MGSPVLKGGGVAFGPHQRSYRQAMPKKMRRLALRSVLSSKCSEGGLKVLNDMQMEHPKTKAFSGILRALGIDGSVLLATGKVEPNVVKSARNLPRVSVIPAALLNVADILAHCNLIMTVDAIRKAEAIWTSQETKKTSDETPQPRNDKE
jgi:large subunit ribosomal protein L4